MNNQPKVAGQICPDCGGTYVQSPKTMKIFCQNKCWLNNQQPIQQVNGQGQVEPPAHLAPQAPVTPPPPQYVPMPQNPPNTPPPAPQPQNTSTQSQDIRANVALKMVSELISAGKIELNDWKTWVDTFNNYKQ